MTSTPDPLREALEAALDFGLSRAEGGGYIRSSGSLAVDVLRGLDLQGYALAQPAPALDVAGEALHTLLAPDLEIQARIEGVEAFVMYAVPGLTTEDAAYLMRAAGRYSALLNQ